MGWPGLRVLLAPTATLFDVLDGADLDWIDVSRWVRMDDGWAFRRGRTGGASGSLAAGTLTVTMDNRTGDWTRGGDGFRRVVIDAVGSEAAADAMFPLLSDGDPPLKGVPLRVCAVLDFRSYGHTAALYPRYADWAAAEAHYSDAAAGYPAETPIWTGAVSAVGTEWADGMRPVAKIQAADAVSWCQRQTLLALPAQSALGAGARWLFTLDGDGGAAPGLAGAPDAPAWPDSSGRRDDNQPMAPLVLQRCGVPVDDNTLTAGAIPGPGADGTAPAWSGGGTVDGWALDTLAHTAGALPSLGPGGGGTATGGTTLHAMAYPAETGLGRARTIVSAEGAWLHRATLGLAADGAPRLIVHDRIYGDTAVTAPAPVTSAEWHHVAGVLVENLTTYETDLQLWVDGALVAGGSHPGSLYTIGSRRVVVGADVNMRNTWDGALCDVAGHGEALSPTLLMRLAAGRHGFTGDDAGRRTARLLWSIGMPQAERAVGVSTMMPQPTAGKTLAEAFDACAAAEQSMWLPDGEGHPRLLPRSWAWEANAAATIPASSLDGGLRWDLDDEGRVTVATVTRPGLADVTVRADAWRQLGCYERTEAVLVDSLPQAEAVALSWIDGHALPAQRSTEMAVDLVACRAAVDVDALCTAGPGAVLAVSGLPDASPAGLTRVVVDGVADHVSTAGWLRTFTVRPAPRQNLSTFRLAVSLLGGTDTIAL
jgi:hypothetical protein